MFALDDRMLIEGCVQSQRPQRSPRRPPNHLASLHTSLPLTPRTTRPRAPQHGAPRAQRHRAALSCPAPAVTFVSCCASLLPLRELADVGVEVLVHRARCGPTASVSSARVGSATFATGCVHPPDDAQFHCRGARHAPDGRSHHVARSTHSRVVIPIARRCRNISSGRAPDPTRWCRPCARSASGCR